MFCMKCNVWRGCSTFCSLCGSELVEDIMKCPKCHGESAANKYTYYCKWCGSPLQDIPLVEVART